VLLADDSAAILRNVAKTVAEKFEVVGAVNEGQAALDECRRLKPDVVVLDISMGDADGIQVARKLRDSGSSSKVVFLTVHEDADFVSAALGAGGLAYVVKSRLSTDLVSGITAAFAGETFLSPGLRSEWE
jgi:DNA-binding NarL/FixJ family response regulator